MKAFIIPTYAVAVMLLIASFFATTIPMTLYLCLSSIVMGVLGTAFYFYHHHHDDNHRKHKEY